MKKVLLHGCHSYWSKKMKKFQVWAGMNISKNLVLEQAHISSNSSFIELENL